MILVGTFAGLAMVLIIVGLFGVMTYSVTRRTREIGVRMALGAQRAGVLKMVLGEAVVLLAWESRSAWRRRWFRLLCCKACCTVWNRGVRWFWVLVSVAVSLAGLAAAYVPAFRATKVDPMVALRYE